MPSADILFTNAKVITADPRRPHAQAVAVRGKRIAFVGGAQDARRWQAARIIDAQQCTLMPGFIDAHFHLLSGAIALSYIQLDAAARHADIELAVSQYRADHANETCWLGQGLRYGILPEDKPFRLTLDALVPDRPLILFAYDHHTAWVNTAALERAGILHSGDVTAPNSEIVRDAGGTATGELREKGAIDWVDRLILKPDHARQRALLRNALQVIAASGITSVHNMDGNLEQLALYAAMEDADEMTLRVYVPYSVTPDTTEDMLAEAVAMRDNYRSEFARAGSVKFFMDGVIESYTALLLQPYADRATHGDANFSPEHFTRMALACDKRGLQIIVHSIGDAATRRTLDGFQAVRREHGRRDSRHRIEHIELIHPDDLPRFSALGVLASVQPYHAPLAMPSPDVWPRRVGERRWPDSFAWQTLRQSGARLVFGSDWPVVTFNPMVGMYAALNRRPWTMGHTPQQQTLADTIASYTREAAYAEFQEDEKGQLREGLLADMVLLPVDLEQTPYESFAQIRPVLTLCNGRVIFER